MLTRQDASRLVLTATFIQTLPARYLTPDPVARFNCSECVPSRASDPAAGIGGIVATTETSGLTARMSFRRESLCEWANNSNRGQEQHDHGQMCQVPPSSGILDQETGQTVRYANRPQNVYFVRNCAHLLPTGLFADRARLSRLFDVVRQHGRSSNCSKDASGSGFGSG